MGTEAPPRHTRPHQVLVRLSDEEFTLLKSAADETKPVRTVASLLRDTAIRKYRRNRKT